MKHFFFIFIGFSLTGCDPYDNRLTLINNSSEMIFFDISENGQFSKEMIIIDSKSRDTLWNYMNFIKPNQSLKIPLLGKNSWEDYINNECKDSTITVFIFNSELLRSSIQQTLIKKQQFTKKYLYKVADLKRLNWVIDYN